MQQNIKKVEERGSSLGKRDVKNDDLDSLDEMPNEIDRLVKLEQLALNQVKIPINTKKDYKNYNINRSDPTEGFAQSHDEPASGIVTTKRHDIDDVMKHNYLRKSMEQRVQRKALLKNFRMRQQQTLKSSGSKETISSKLRSMTI